MDNFVVAITRTCGSGATSISKILGKELGVEIYDRNILRLASDESGISYELFAQADEDQKKSILFRASQKVYNGEVIPPESSDFVSNNNLFNYQAKVLREMADESSFICIGRAADYVLNDKPNIFKVYIYASKEKCIEKEMKRQKSDRKTAEKYIAQTDKFRRDYYRYYTGQEWENMKNYDLCLNTTDLSFEEAAIIIKDYVLRRMEK